MHLFLRCLVFRLVQALLLRTYFAPDEHWQSTEVAHRLVFGDGHLTWEWAVGLRPYLHPALFAAPYWLLAAARLDAAWAVVLSSHLVQAAIAALADVSVHALAAELAPEDASTPRWALACQLASWFNGYALVRTYSNSAEAALCVLGVLNWTKAAAVPTAAAQWRWLCAAAAAFALRPHSALFWLVPGSWRLARLPPWQRPRLAAMAAALGAATLALGMLVDRAGYGRWVCTPWSFFRFNLLEGGSAQYGSHPWSWNVTQGFPAVLASYVGLAAIALRGQLKRGGRLVPLLAFVSWSVAVQSISAHKEFRFLLPALQLSMPLVGLGAARLWGRPRVALRAALAAALLTQVLLWAFFGLVQHRAQIGVMPLLRGAALARTDPGAAPLTALFLTPCHATPYWARMHGAAARMRFLDCSPARYRGEVAALNAAAQAWLPFPDGLCLPGQSELECLHRRPVDVARGLVEAGAPSHVVLFAPLGTVVGATLAEGGYALWRSLPNCWVQVDEDYPCTLQVWART
ncbi:hypothetical protein ACKKBG_A01165 [Auxenochlorella protothecoides x Auxenochlorella symbiontica]